MTELAARNRFVTDIRPVEEKAGAGGGAMAIPLDEDRGEPLVAAAPVQAPELIEPGRALALADFDPPPVSAGERLMRLAYRMGVSGHALVAPFRKPMKPRLLATVDSPLPGDPVSGTALRAGHFLVHGIKIPVAQADFSPVAKLAPAFERTLIVTALQFSILERRVHYAR